MSLKKAVIGKWTLVYAGALGAAVIGALGLWTPTQAVARSNNPAPKYKVEGGGRDERGDVRPRRPGRGGRGGRIARGRSLAESTNAVPASPTSTSRPPK